MCASTTGITYSIPAIATATSYAWTLPTGASITSGDNTNAITVSFATTSGVIKVTPSNTCGTAAPASKTITLTDKPTAAGEITGLASVCASTAGVTYSIPAIATATSYAWTLPTGASITSGDNTNTITVSFATTGGVIKVTPSNTCGTAAPASKTITLTARPTAAGEITGLASVCASTAGVTYSIPVIATATSYAWALPTGAVITAGANTNAITVSFATTGGTIQVTPGNTCGTAAPASKSVQIIPIGSAPCTAPVTSAIEGPSNIAPNVQNVTFSVTQHAGSAYTWAVPDGATIVSGLGSSSIVVNFGNSGGIVSVQESNSYGTGTAVTKNVTMISTAIDASSVTDIQINIHPNPSEQYCLLTTTTPAEELIDVTIIDMKGVVIMHLQWNTSQPLVLNSDLSAGIYIVQLKIQEQFITKRLIRL